MSNQYNRKHTKALIHNGGKYKYPVTLREEEAIAIADLATNRMNHKDHCALIKAGMNAIPVIGMGANGEMVVGAEDATNGHVLTFPGLMATTLVAKEEGE